jgi:hypothetical protein
MPKGLTWHVTGLWHPADTGLANLPYYGMIADPSDGLVEIPLNDSRTATVTVSEYDPIIEALRDPTTHRGSSSGARSSSSSTASTRWPPAP